MARLDIEHLVKRYGDFHAVKDVSLSIADGEFLVLLGPSGCGKTTTLRMVAGFIEPTAGRVLLGGQDVTLLPPWKRNAGMVFQSYALFPHMTVAQNVAFGLEMRKLPRADIERRVEEALALVPVSYTHLRAHETKANLALRHDDQAVRDGQRLLLVVRHHHGGEAELALQLADLDAHFLLQLGIEVRQRLVEQQHIGPDGERAGQRHALLLAA